MAEPTLTIMQCPRCRKCKAVKDLTPEDTVYCSHHGLFEAPVIMVPKPGGTVADVFKPRRAPERGLR